MVKHATSRYLKLNWIAGILTIIIGMFSTVSLPFNQFYLILSNIVCFAVLARAGYKIFVKSV